MVQEKHMKINNVKLMVFLNNNTVILMNGRLMLKLDKKNYTMILRLKRMLLDLLEIIKLIMMSQLPEIQEDGMLNLIPQKNHMQLKQHL